MYLFVFILLIIYLLIVNKCEINEPFITCDIKPFCSYDNVLPIIHPSPMIYFKYKLPKYWRTIGYLKSNKKIYKLYERKLDEYTFSYIVRVYHGYFSPVITEGQKLKNNESVNIENMFGSFKVKINSY